MTIKFRPHFLLALASVLLLSSCVSRKRIAYFQELKEGMAINQENDLKIKPDDVLSIKVFAPEQEAALPFNLISVQGTATGGANEQETYLVREDGTVKFPELGAVAAGGLTTVELEDVLEKRLLDFVQDPLVIVRIENFQISVLGEVGNPGTFSIEGENINLPKAIGLAGDIPLTGKRKKVLVMREENGKTTYEYLDLTQADVVSSPFYNLRQNDIVYVEPTGPKIQTGSYLGTASGYLSIASVLVSLVLLITR